MPDPPTTAGAFPSTRWRLTAPESYILLHGLDASPRDAFKLGLMELVARGALVLDNDARQSGRRGTRRIAALRDGPNPITPREIPLQAIWDLWTHAPRTTFENGWTAVTVDDLAKRRGRLRHLSQDRRPARRRLWPHRPRSEPELSGTADLKRSQPRPSWCAFDANRRRSAAWAGGVNAMDGRRANLGSEPPARRPPHGCAEDDPPGAGRGPPHAPARGSAPVAGPDRARSAPTAVPAHTAAQTRGECVMACAAV